MVGLHMQQPEALLAMRAQGGRRGNGGAELARDVAERNGRPRDELQPQLTDALDGAAGRDRSSVQTRHDARAVAVENGGATTDVDADDRLQLSESPFAKDVAKGLWNISGLGRGAIFDVPRPARDNRR